MDIDLELPSHEQEKFDLGSNENANTWDTEFGMGGENGDTNSPKGGQINVKGSAVSCGDEVDVNNIAVDIANKEAIFEPKNGLEFESKEAAYSFYREYAQSVGFGITIKASRRSKRSGKFIDVKIACSRFGNKREPSTIVNLRSCPKTGCKAGLHMKRRQDEKWIIHSFVKEHNHEICPDDVDFAIRRRNKQSGPVACRKKGLQCALDERDVQLMLEHLMSMQDENPGFFYALDLDHEKRVRNVFWIDAKGKHDYMHFNDVVLLETFYVRNKYSIPFVPIIGVNHQFQYVLLACCLIGDMSTSAFVWLMRTWLKAVSGQAPRVIITDQDKTLNEVIAEVFPDSRHCFCLWHVLGKMSENLGSNMSQDENFSAKFKKCIHYSWTHEQFEKRWWKIVENFELKENAWVCSLYEDRKKWVPTYMHNTFLGGMSTTDRSESIISFFDKYMHKAATFSEFIEQYKSFLQDRYEKGGTTDFEALNKQPALRPLSSFEKQMSLIYTDTIFKKFQVEVLGVGSCHLQKESEDDNNAVFRVDDFKEHQVFFVALNKREVKACCLCRSFEYRGFLCKHVILVLQMSGISEIPSQYILRRWTKDAKNRQNMGELLSRYHCRVQRFNDLCKRAIKLGEEGSLSQESYDIAFQALEEALKHCVGANNSVKNVMEPNRLAIHGFLKIEEDSYCNSSVKSSKKKKMHKKRKVHSEMEGMSIGLQESSQPMMNSSAHVLDNCYFPQQDMHGMDLGSRAPNLDGYYGSQQNMQGVRRMNSVSPIRDGYYSNPQSLPELGQVHPMPTCVNHYGTQEKMQGLNQLGFRTPSMLGCFDIEDNMQDVDHAVHSANFHGISSKHLHDKRLY